MNTDEGVELGKGGFRIFLVILVVGAVIGIATFGYNQLNKGQNQLSDRANTIQNMNLSSLAGASTKGDVVYAKIGDFISQGLVVAVAPKNTNYSDIVGSSSSGTKFYNCGQQAVFNATGSGGGSTGTGNIEIECSIQQTPTATGGTSGSTTPKIVRSGTDGKWYVGQTPNGTQAVAGSIDTTLQNPNTFMLTEQSSDFYIQSGMTYYSELIYDPSTLQTIGVVFMPLG